RDGGIAREITRVGGEILRRRELQGVHEERDDDEVVLDPRVAHERAMAGVEVAHRRDETDAPTERARVVARGAELMHAADGDHAGRPCSSARSSASSRAASVSASSARARYVSRSASGRASRCAATVRTSPRATGPVRAVAGPWCAQLARVVAIKGRNASNG